MGGFEQVLFLQLLEGAHRSRPSQAVALLRLDRSGAPDRRRNPATHGIFAMGITRLTPPVASSQEEGKGKALTPPRGLGAPEAGHGRANSKDT